MTRSRTPALPMRPHRRFLCLFALAIAGLPLALRLDAQTDSSSRPHTAWIAAGSRQTLPAEMVFENALGRLGVLNRIRPD